MTDTVDALVEFLSESDFWKQTLAIIDDPDVVFHESRVDTGLDPLALEYLFRELITRRGADVRNVGHAAFGELAWIKLYCVGAPVFNLTWRHRPEVVLEPYVAEPFATWRHSDVAAYLEEFEPPLPTRSDMQEVHAYLASEHWQEQMLAKIADPEIEHFHLYLETELDPRFVDVLLGEALRQAGIVSRVPTFFLANARRERPAMWVGQAPDGSTSWEIVLYHAPGVALAPTITTDAERAYGGDGWTSQHYRDHVDSFRWSPLTVAEADAVLARVG
jgi:hypothetical protein